MTQPFATGVFDPARARRHSDVRWDSPPRAAAEASADDEEPEIDENAATTAIPSLRATTTNAANLATATTPGKSILKTPSRSKTPGGRGDAPKTPKSAFGVYYLSLIHI